MTLNGIRHIERSYEARQVNVFLYALCGCVMGFHGCSH